MALLNRLNTEKSLAPYVAQFVPLKLDVATPEYADLQRKYPSEGNTIPKIFLIRADGRKLYAQSGALPGEQLQTLVVAAVREMGRPLGLNEVKVLEEINQRINEALDNRDYGSVVDQFSKVSKLGDFGQIPSFAASAIANNELAAKFQTEVQKQQEHLASQLDSSQNRLAAIQALQLKSEIGSFPPFRVLLNELDKQVRQAMDSPDAYSQVKDIATALARLKHSSSRIQQRAATELQQVTDKLEDPATVAWIQNQLKESGVEPEPENPDPAYRTWTSHDGRFSTEAQLVDFDSDQVRLRKKSGEVIQVPREKLSPEDLEYLAKQNE